MLVYEKGIAMIGSKCRVCKGKTIRAGFLYRCRNKKCSSVFWDKTNVKKSIKEDPNNIEKIVDKARIPKTKKGYHYVYVLRMRQNPNDKGRPYKPTEYVGETALHPYRRYLHHIIGKKDAKRAGTKKYATALIYFKGKKMNRTEGELQEKKLIEERKALGINVLGGHKEKGVNSS